MLQKAQKDSQIFKHLFMIGLFKGVTEAKYPSNYSFKVEPNAALKAEV